MLGKNELYRIDHSSGKVLAVAEIFTTLQGEGPLTGTPAVFVRLAHCNLRCWYCDTEFDSNVEQYDIEELLRKIVELADTSRFRTNLVVITGGEPLRQNISQLVMHLQDRHFDVQIETAGTVWHRDLESLLSLDTLVCSPKTPRVNGSVIWYCRHWKYIVAPDDCDQNDGLPVCSTQRNESAVRAPVYRATRGTIWVQPRFEYLDNGEPNEVHNAENTAHAVAIAKRYGYRLSLQQHKLLNLP